MKCKDCTVEKLLRENLQQKTREYERVGREVSSGIKISQTLFAYERARQEKEIAEQMLTIFMQGKFQCPLLKEENQK